MEPDLAADPRHLDVLHELLKRERIFHRPRPGTARRDLERMTEPEFREVGASGRRYGRQQVLEILEHRCEDPAEDVWEMRDVHCLEIARDHYLLTYTLLQGERVTRRATIWRRRGVEWRIVYHQGTLVEGT